MKEIPDRKKLRLEYKRCRRIAQVRFSIAMCKVTVSLLLGLSFACWAVFDLPKAIDGHPMNDWLGSMIGTCGCFGLLPVFLCYRLEYFNAKHRLDALPCIPFENAETLPADEILVRGSDAPPFVQSEELLRGATAAATAKEELLRVSQ